MSMRLATLGTPLTEAPATREAAPASNAPDGSFNHAMNDARQADAPAPTTRPEARKATPGEPVDKPADGASANDPSVAALLAQLLATPSNMPSNTPANMPALPLGMHQAGAPDAEAPSDAVGASKTHDGAGALSGMSAALSPMQTLRMASSGVLAGLSPAARALNKGQQAMPANLIKLPNLPMAGLSATLNADQGNSPSAQAVTAQATSPSFADASRSGEANRADTPSSAPASGTPANWASVMANLAERPAGTSGHPGAALTLPSPSPEHWKEPLLNTLGERVQWQIQRGSEQALIRLEPPHLGQIDIVIRQEAGQMQVHLSATHREVAQQLQGISDGLRQELSLRQAADVQVQVSDQSAHGYKGQGQRQNQQDTPAREPGRALGSADDQTSAKSGFSMQADQG